MSGGGEMTQEALRKLIDPCFKSLLSNICDAENAMCQFLAVGDYAERLKGFAHEEAFAIIQRNAVANLAISLYKPFEGPDRLTLVKLTKTIESYLQYNTLSINPLMNRSLREWLQPNKPVDAVEECPPSDNEVIRLLIERIREMSPKANKPAWTRLEVLRRSVAHNCVDAGTIESATVDEAVQHLNFLMRTEKAFRFGIFGFSEFDREPELTVEVMKRKKAYRDLQKVIESCLVAYAKPV